MTTGTKVNDILGKNDYEYALPFYGIRRPILIDMVFRFDEEIKKKYLFVSNEGDVHLAEGNVSLKGKCVYSRLKQVLYMTARATISI